MSHFAKVLDGKVTQIIVAEPEFFDTFVDSSPGEWIQTSYNTLGGVHATGGIPLRGNYAGVGYTYDKTNDVFYAARPYASWTISAPTWTWTPPVPYPIDVGTPEAPKRYTWNENTTSWDLITT
jgi:hypothetical protein